MRRSSYPGNSVRRTAGITCIPGSGNAHHFVHNWNWLLPGLARLLPVSLSIYLILFSRKRRDKGFCQVDAIVRHAPRNRGWRLSDLWHLMQFAVCWFIGTRNKRFAVLASTLEKSGHYSVHKDDSLLNRKLPGEYARVILLRLNRTRQSSACLLRGGSLLPEGCIVTVFRVIIFCLKP